MNIAAYCRVSTDKSDQLNSLETQKEFFLENIPSAPGTTSLNYMQMKVFPELKLKNVRNFSVCLQMQKKVCSIWL